MFLQRARLFGSALIFAAVASASGWAGAKELVVGSKRFTESYILGEILTQTLVASGAPAVHKPGLGNTGILEQALASGAVDLYPEYTGTIVRELLKREGNPSLEELNRWLAPRGLKAAVPFGFNNTYALAIPRARPLRSACGPSPICSGLARRACGSACRTSSSSAPTAGRRSAAPTALPRQRRSDSTTAWPTTPSPAARST
jgi:hypothetical protein